MKQYFAAIDPGVRGALAVIDEAAAVVLLLDAPAEARPGAKKTKKGNKSSRLVFNVDDLCAVLRRIKHLHPRPRLAIELVGPMPGQGGRNLYAMGEGVGLYRGMLRGLNYFHDRVRPQDWKACFFQRGKRDKSEDAKAALRVARRLFPAADLSLEKHEGRADALLLAEFIRRRALDLPPLVTQVPIKRRSKKSPRRSR